MADIDIDEEDDFNRAVFVIAMTIKEQLAKDKRMKNCFNRPLDE